MCEWIVLRRLSYPNRIGDLLPLFGRSPSEISMIFNRTIDCILQNKGQLLARLDQPWLRDNLEQFAAAVYTKGAPIKNCWGFIDGTVRAICRPSQNQDIVFNGHKRVHALKFQVVVSPNGLIAHMYGPIEGRRHDSALLAESGLMNELQGLVQQNGEPYCIYGDLAYPLRETLMTPFKGANLTAEEQQFNRDMSLVRQAVEWAFGEIQQLFAFVDFKKNLKLYLQPVAKYYLLGALLTNCHTCLYQNQIGEYFQVPAPTLEVYLN